MQRMTSKVTSQWKQPLATREFTTGVSLHSHTSVSEETLGFIHAMFVVMPGLKRVFDFYADCSARYGVTLDYARANWRPPLQPRMAYDLESRQIQRLGLNSLVSITDHDTIEAPMLLRTVPSSRHIPVSVEWSAPFGQTIFHLGIHNIPSRDGMEWMRRFEGYTAAADANPGTAEMDARLLSMLRELHESPQVLIVFNHPLWDLHKVGPMHHGRGAAVSARGWADDSCDRAEWVAACAREPRCGAAGEGDGAPGDLGRRPAWAGAECEYQPDVGCELYGVRGGDSGGPHEPCALYGAVSGALGAADLPLHAECGD